jgi:hypothetical protein
MAWSTYQQGNAFNAFEYQISLIGCRLVMDVPELPRTKLYFVADLRVFISRTIAARRQEQHVRLVKADDYHVIELACLADALRHFVSPSHLGKHAFRDQAPAMSLCVIRVDAYFVEWAYAEIRALAKVDVQDIRAQLGQLAAKRGLPGPGKTMDDHELRHQEILNIGREPTWPIFS